MKPSGRKGQTIPRSYRLDGAVNLCDPILVVFGRHERCTFRGLDTLVSKTDSVPGMLVVQRTIHFSGGRGGDFRCPRRYFDENYGKVTLEK
jgi:hypothetical protein